MTSDLTRAGGRDAGLSFPELFDYRDGSGVFSEICGIWPIDANITGMERPERAEVLLADTNYFRLLGVRAQAGRVFTDADYQAGIAQVAVISDAFWRRHFGGDPSAVGRTFRLDDDLYTILGVAPPEFRHPGRHRLTEIDVWAPTGWVGPPFSKPDRRGYFLQGALARLKPGVTPRQAQARLEALGAEFRRAYPDVYPDRSGWAPRVLALQDDLVGSAKVSLLVLLGSVGFVLLIACANVANLLLARASARQREVAIRQALGAGRRRILRQLLTESLVLAALGGALGLALSVWGVDLLVRLSPASLPRVREISVDAPVLAFTLAASLATGILFGLAPALQSAGRAWAEALKDSTRGSTFSFRGGRMRAALVVVEFALALVLLVAAGLLLRTLWQLNRVDPGFDPKRLVAANLWLPQPNQAETGRYYKHPARAILIRKIFQRLSQLPGVEAAASATSVPFDSNHTTSPFEIEGRDPDRGGTGASEQTSVSPGYFSTLGIRLREGRAFTERDSEETAPVAIVSESFTQRFFAGEDPLGHRLRLPTRDGMGPWTTIVGMAGDVKTRALDLENRPILYRPLLQVSTMSVAFTLRGSATPAELAAGVDRAVRSVDPELPIYSVRSMEDSVAETVAQRRFAMRLLGLFASIALLLAGVGVYGVIAYSVSQRTHEIGIRLALGARPSDVRRLLLREGARLALAGVALGTAGSLLLTRAMSSLLFGIGPRDPVTFGAIPLFLALVAVAASDFPARRASRLDPVAALRGE